MLIEITFRPIDQWPEGWRDRDRGATRVPGRFRSTYDQTTKLLREELRELDATSAHVQLDITSAELRRDGMLRAGMTVEQAQSLLRDAAGPDDQVIRWGDYEQGLYWHDVEDLVAERTIDSPGADTSESK